ncbi:hypothetical protein Tco_1308341 [Tanacetum coccineum]
MAAEVPQTLEYRGGQLNAAPLLEVENFTNWKKRFIFHIIGIEPRFKTIIENGPFIPMIASQRKPEGQWTSDERKDFQDSLDDKKDTKSSQEYMDDLEEEYQARALLAKSKRMCHFHKPELRPSKDFEAKYNKVKAKLALLSSSASASKSSMVKNKGLVAKEYKWDEENVPSDENETIKVKVLMALADDENLVVDKESARNA